MRHFGIGGPGCGGARTAWYLLHGDPVQAARHHLAALIALPFAGYGMVAWTAAATLGRRLLALPILRWTWVGYTAFFLRYTVVLRNLP